MIRGVLSLVVNTDDVLGILLLLLPTNYQRISSRPSGQWRRAPTGVRPTSGRAIAPTSSRKLPARPSCGRAIIVLVCSCAHDCDAELTGCTAATAARISSRLSGQWRRARTGVRPTCGRAIVPTIVRNGTGLGDPITLSDWFRLVSSLPVVILGGGMLCFDAHCLL